MYGLRKLNWPSTWPVNFGTGVLLLALGAQPAVGEPTPDGFIPCSNPAAPRAAPFLAEKVTLDIRDVAVREVVENLQNKLALPISFIEASEVAKITLRLAQVPAVQVIGNLLSQVPGYRCDLVESHVVIYPDQGSYLQEVSGVSIVDEFRGAAARQYLDHIEIKGLQGIAFLATGLLEGEVLSEKVSLRPKARVIEHLAQMLGPNERVFFVIRESPGGRYLTFGAAHSQSAR